MSWPEVRIPAVPCGARLRNPREDGRERCVKLVLGGGPCRSHGGGAPQIKAAREQRLVQMRAEAAAAARNPHEPLPSPAEAMLLELQRTHRTIAGLEQRLAAMDDLAGQQGQQLVSVDERQALADRLRAERGHYARVAESCVRFGVAPEVGSVAQEHAGQLMRLLEALLRRMGFDPFDPEVVAVVRGTLRELEAGLLDAPGASSAGVAPSFADVSQLPGRVVEGDVA